MIPSVVNQADRILINATVVTRADDYRVIPGGALAVKDDSILAVGTTEEVLSSFSATEIVDCGGKALIPGLVTPTTF